MHQIEISDRAFQWACEAAASRGQSVGAYVEALIGGDDEEALFTDERISIIEASLIETQNGAALSPEEHRNQMSIVRANWIQAHQP